MAIDAGSAGEVFEVTVEHDDHPEEVAEKFLEVFRAMGIAVEDVSDEDGVAAEYRIGGKATDPASNPAEA